MDKTTCYFGIQTLEEMQKNGSLPGHFPERRNHFEIFWFRSGSGTFTVDLEKYQIGYNQLYCLAPGQFRHCHTDEELRGYHLSFSRDFLCLGASHGRGAAWLDTSNTGRRMPVVLMDPDMQYEVEGIMRKMRKECCNYYLLRSEVLSGLLNILIIDLSRMMPQVNEDLFLHTKEMEMVRKFTSLVKDHFQEMKLVADYAGVLCVTPSHLNRTVKKITGSTASHHIQQQIILEAKQKAIHSNGSMKEIAYLLGFEDLAYFSKFFKKNSGMNFTSFKKKTAELQ